MTWFVFMFFSHSHRGIPSGRVDFLCVCVLFSPSLPGVPRQGIRLMLGALCVRIQSLYSVLVMKDCDKMIYELRRELIITFAKKSNLYIKYFTCISKFLYYCLYLCRLSPFTMVDCSTTVWYPSF